jgi:hypothetical protein
VEARPGWGSGRVRLGCGDQRAAEQETAAVELWRRCSARVALPGHARRGPWYQPGLAPGLITESALPIRSKFTSLRSV